MGTYSVRERVRYGNIFGLLLVMVVGSRIFVERNFEGDGVRRNRVSAVKLALMTPGSHAAPGVFLLRANVAAGWELSCGY